MILCISSLLSFCTSFECMFAACSCFPSGVLPVPSAPWHNTHLDLKISAPAGALAPSCAVAKLQTPTIRTATAVTARPMPADLPFTFFSLREILNSDVSEGPQAQRNLLAACATIAAAKTAQNLFR